MFYSLNVLLNSNEFVFISCLHSVLNWIELNWPPFADAFATLKIIVGYKFQCENSIQFNGNGEWMILYVCVCVYVKNRGTHSSDQKKKKEKQKRLIYYDVCLCALKRLNVLFVVLSLIIISM